MNKKDIRTNRNGTCIRAMRKSGIAMLAVGIILSAGCGGGGSSSGTGGSQIKTISGSLKTSDQTFSDGTYVNFYLCNATASGMATIEMDSSQVDSFLQVGIDDGSATIQTIASDDNSAGGLNAKVSFHVTQGAAYRIAATTSGTGSLTGAYTLIYSNNLTDFVPDNQAVAHFHQN